MPDAPIAAPETAAAPPAPAAAPPPASPPGMEAARIALEQSAAERLRSIPATTAGAVPKVLPPVDGPEVEPVTDLDAPPLAADEAPPLAADESAARRERFTRAADEAKKGRLRREREKEERKRLAAERDEAIRYAHAEAQRRVDAERAAQEAWSMPAEQYLDRRGMSHQDIVKAALDESTPEGRQKALEARIAAKEQAIDQRIQYLDAREKAAAADKAASDFLSVAKSRDDYPTLARIAKTRPQTVLQEANAIMLETARRNNGVYPSFAKVCEYLEWEWSRALRDEAKPNAEPPTRNGASSPQPAAPAPERPAGKSPTLTSRAAERATLPKSPGQMTKDEMIEHYAQQLREQASRG